ncbi:Transcription termination/antitermination protein NusA [Buchnera aphidicola (Panaphis juglandis)]
MNKEIVTAIQLISNEKSLPCEKIFEALESAISIAIRKKYIQDIDIRVSIDRLRGKFNIFRRWMIVKQVMYPTKEITLEAARFENKKAQLREFVEDKIQFMNFNRVATQIAKKIIIKKVREAEKSMIVDKFYQYKGQIVKGVVRKINGDCIILNLNHYIEAKLYKIDMLPKENFRLGDRVRGILYEINSKRPGTKLLISRSRAEMLVELFRIEVPEINEKTVEIKAIARDPGFRAKIAVQSHDKRIDPVGACVGMRGARVQSVSEEMSGERIDIILWDNNPAQFVINAMAPVPVISVIVHKNIHTIDIAVKHKNLAQAIGRNGQNVRLAAQLSGWELNVMTLSDLQFKNKTEIHKIRSVFHRNLNIPEQIIDILIHYGFFSLKELACIPYLQLLKINGINRKMAHIIQDKSDNYLSRFLI